MVATDATLTKEQVNKLAEMAYAGLARVIRPLTMLDGDVIFALSYGRKKADLSASGQAAAEALAEAIVRGVTQAQGLHGIPAHNDLR